MFWERVILIKAFYESRPETFYAGPMTIYPFPLHLHELVEVIVMLKGRCCMQMDNETYILQSGDAAIAFPLVPHSFEWIDPDALGFTAIFMSDAITEFASMFQNMMPDLPVIRNEYANEDARFAVDRMMSQNEDSPMQLAYLHVLMSHLLGGMSLHPASDYKERSLGSRIARYVYDHACEQITLSGVARSLGISESHLSHLFARQFQMNFRRFINAIRIDKAIMLMRYPNLTLTQISDQCGFENLRTFRRAFVRETGSLPAVYIRSARNIPSREDAAALSDTAPSS